MTHYGCISGPLRNAFKEFRRDISSQRSELRVTEQHRTEYDGQLYTDWTRSMLHTTCKSLMPGIGINLGEYYVPRILL